jgi:replicative DNA helicase
MVDFMQDLKGAETEAGVAEIGRKLKNIAKELNICIIALSQLSRDKFNPKPTMSRLRGSGQLGEKADVIMLMWRPNTYGLEIDSVNYNSYGDISGDVAEIIIAKGRNVGTGSFLLDFDKFTTKFSNLTKQIEVIDYSAGFSVGFR